MSLLTQFYPSSSGGGGASTNIGYLSGVPYGDTGITGLSYANYNPTTGVYYLAMTGRYTIDTNNFVYYKVLSSPDGANFNLSFATESSYNQSYSFLGIGSPGTGSVNDAPLFGLSQTSFGSTSSYIYTTPQGGGSTAQVGFLSPSFPDQLTFFNSVAYYTAGNRYYLVARDRSDSIDYTYYSTNGSTWTKGSQPVVGNSASTFSARGRTQGYVSSAGSQLGKTTDGGLNWNLVGVTIPSGATQLAAGAEGTSNLIVGTYYTTNDGATWLPMNLPAGVGGISSPAYSDLADRYIGWAQTASPFDPAYGKMIVSTDGTGSTWNFAASGNPELAAQLYGRTLGTNAAIGLGTNLYYLPAYSAIAQGAQPVSTAVVAQVDVSTL